MIKVFFSLAMMAALLLQTGCAFKDIDKRIFVLAIGIDPSEKVRDGFKVTLKLAKPSGDVKLAISQDFTYLSHDSDSIAEALRKLETHVDKKLDLGHARSIVINKELISKDLNKFMDVFTRRGDIQMISYVAVSEKTAEETVKFSPDTEPPATIALFNFFDNTGTQSPYISTTFLFEMRRKLLNKGIDAVLPIIDINEEQKSFVVNKALVLRWGKKPLELTELQTKYLNSLIKDVNEFNYEIKEDDHHMILFINRVKMHYKIILDDGPPRIDMYIVKIGIISESDRDLNNAHVKKYSKEAEDDIKKKVVELLTKLQENNLDPFGFGLRYRATRLSREGLMDDWERIYPEIKFNVNVRVELKATGAIE